MIEELEETLANRDKEIQGLKTFVTSLAISLNTARDSFLEQNVTRSVLVYSPLARVWDCQRNDLRFERGNIRLLLTGCNPPLS